MERASMEIAGKHASSGWAKILSVVFCLEHVSWFGGDAR